MKALTTGAELENSGKKFTNHSLRNTTVKKLKAANVPEFSIIKVTRHTSTKGLNSYDPGDENEFRCMSNALNASSAAPYPVYQSSPHIALHYMSRKCRHPTMFSMDVRSISTRFRTLSSVNLKLIHSNHKTTRKLFKLFHPVSLYYFNSFVIYFIELKVGRLF